MARPRTEESEVPIVSVGRRLSRRAFLRSAAVAGASVVGLAGVSTVSGSRRPSSDGRVPAAQSLGDPIGDLADALFYDVEALFRFVVDNVRYEPYTGILRGARGTLAARSGNSADQAQLLAALLDASLIPFRYAIGSIDQATGERLVGAALADEAALTSATFDALAGRIPELPTDDPPTGPEAQAISEVAAATEDAVLAWAQQELGDTVAAIEGVLGESGIALPRDFTTVPEAELERHMWVQALVGPDWVDLDPSLAGTAWGEAVGSASETADELPDELYHWVDLAVIGESVSDSGISTERLLSLSTRADRLAGLPITFVNANPTGVERLGEVITPVAGSLSYVPSIIIGDEAFAGLPIRFGRGDDLGEGLLDGADDLLGGAAGGAETSAQWLELTVSSPGREPVIVSRTIFDRLGAEARAAGAVDVSLAPIEAIPLDAGSTPEVIPALATTWLAVDVGLPSRDAPIMNPDDEAPGATAAYAQGQHYLRAISDLALGLPAGTRSFVDAPNITAFSVTPVTGDAGEQAVQLGLDIWHRSRGVMPVLGADVSLPPATVAGVLDHVAERVLSGDATAADAADGGDVPAASVGAVFAGARRDGVPLRIVQDAADVADLAYPADAAAVLRASLGDGWVAVAPERTVDLPSGERTGWWLVHPASGHAIDQLDDGRGAIEYQATLTPGQLAQETARQKLARDCLAGSMLTFAAIIATVCGTYSALEGNAKTALACGGAMGGAGVSAVRPLAACLGAGFPG